MSYTPNHRLDEAMTSHRAANHAENDNRSAINGNAYVNGTSRTSEHVLPQRPASHASSRPPEQEPASSNFSLVGTRGRLSDPGLLAHVGDQFQNVGADADALTMRGRSAVARLDLTGVVELHNDVNGCSKNEAAEGVATQAGN